MSCNLKKDNLELRSIALHQGKLKKTHRSKYTLVDMANLKEKCVGSGG